MMSRYAPVFTVTAVAVVVFAAVGMWLWADAEQVTETDTSQFAGAVDEEHVAALDCLNTTCLDATDVDSVTPTDSLVDLGSFGAITSVTITAVDAPSVAPAPLIGSTLDTSGLAAGRYLVTVLAGSDVYQIHVDVP